VFTAQATDIDKGIYRMFKAIVTFLEDSLLCKLLYYVNFNDKSVSNGNADIFIFCSMNIMTKVFLFTLYIKIKR